MQIKNVKIIQKLENFHEKELTLKKFKSEYPEIFKKLTIDIHN